MSSTESSEGINNNNNNDLSLNNSVEDDIPPALVVKSDFKGGESVQLFKDATDIHNNRLFALSDIDTIVKVSNNPCDNNLEGFISIVHHGKVKVISLSNIRQIVSNNAPEIENEIVSNNAPDNENKKVVNRKKRKFFSHWTAEEDAEFLRQIGIHGLNFTKIAQSPFFQKKYEETTNTKGVTVAAAEGIAKRWREHLNPNLAKHAKNNDDEEGELC